MFNGTKLQVGVCLVQFRMRHSETRLDNFPAVCFQSWRNLARKYSCTVRLVLCVNYVVVSYKFYYYVCSPKKLLLAADEAYHHLTQTRMASYHVDISAQRCLSSLGLTCHVECLCHESQWITPKGLASMSLSCVEQPYLGFRLQTDSVSGPDAWALPEICYRYPFPQQP